MRSMMSCGSLLIFLGLIGFVLFVPAVAEQFEELNAIRIELFSYIGAPDLVFAVVGVAGAMILFLGMIGQEVQSGNRGYVRGGSYSSGYSSSGGSQGGTLGAVAGLLLILCLVGTLTPVGLYVYRDSLPFELPYDLSVVFGEQGLPVTGAETPTPDLALPGVDAMVATEVPMVEPTPTAPLVLERGWTLYERPDCNVSIALPPAWAVANLEASTVSDALAPMREIEPLLYHPYLEDLGMDGVRELGLCFYSIDMGAVNALDQYNVSFNMIYRQLPSEFPLQAVVDQLVVDIQNEENVVPEQRNLTIPAGDIVELKIRKVKQDIDYQFFQYVLLKGRDLVVATYAIEAADYEVRQYLGEQIMGTVRWME